MQTNYKLHAGLKEVIDIQGADILCSAQLYNILADYAAYEEYPSTKVVFKDIVTRGYNTDIYNIYKTNASNPQSKINGLKAKFKKSSKYKEDIIDYVFDSICFALGLISTIKEPTSKGLDPYIKDTDSILDKLPKMLADLKVEYNKALQSLIVKPKDLIWDATAYYPASAENQLYLISGKIKVIANQLGTNDYEQCLQSKQKVLNQNKNLKIGAVEEYLQSKKNEYCELLKKSLVIPGSRYISKPAYFDTAKLVEITKAEELIVCLYKEKEQAYDQWCENEKQRILAPYCVSSEKKARQILLKIALPAAILCGSGYYGESYLSSSDSIERYEQQISKASAFEESSEYSKAIETYMMAANGYDGSFNSGGYVAKANNKADLCFDKIKDIVTQQVEGKKYRKVLSLLSTLPENYLYGDQKRQDWVDKIKIEMSNSVEAEIDNLANQISASGGKLDENSRELLEDLLAVSPDNYWLRFIKNKK